MNVVPLLVMVSLLLVAASLLMFARSMAQKDHQHADRLALLPLESSEQALHADGTLLAKAAVQPPEQP